MESDKFQKGIDELKKVGLPAGQKQVVFNRLNFYTNEKPVLNSPAPSHFWSIFSYSRQLSYATLAIVVVFGSGGILVASKNSLPGELLYPVKVNVSEPLQGVATFSDASKVSWEAEKVEARLE